MDSSTRILLLDVARDPVRVQVQHGDRVVEAEARDHDDLVTAAAATTLAAIARLVPPSVELELAETHVVGDEHPIVVVHATVTVAHAPIAHAGCALVRDDPALAAARAALAAVNRRIEVMIP